MLDKSALYLAIKCLSCAKPKCGFISFQRILSSKSLNKNLFNFSPQHLGVDTLFTKKTLLQNCHEYFYQLLFEGQAIVAVKEDCNVKAGLLQTVLNSNSRFYDVRIMIYSELYLKVIENIRNVSPETVKFKL